jgi:hypothetical protein
MLEPTLAFRMISQGSSRKVSIVLPYLSSLWGKRR